MDLFLQKGPEIVVWEKDFNKKRYSEYLKNLVSDHDKKTDEINNLMKEQLDITEQQLEERLEDIGMKGLGLRDKWAYWRNREVLMSLREFSLHTKLNLNISQGKERQELERKLRDIEGELR